MVAYDLSWQLTNLARSFGDKLVRNKLVRSTRERVEVSLVFDGWMDAWMDGWMGGWVGGWVDGCNKSEPLSLINKQSRLYHKIPSPNWFLVSFTCFFTFV